MIPIAKPLIGDIELTAVQRPLTSGWVTQGPEVAAFECEFAEFVGARHACAVSSGTTALHLALRALGVTAGSEVITVSHSFIATAAAVRYCGATPVFVDVVPLTYNMDPDRLAAAFSPKTQAVVAVHQIGMPCHLERIAAIAADHGVPLVEDAACAIGSEIRWDSQWQRIGRPHGDIACFSFHPRKLLTTGEGGMLTTSNAEWDAMFRRWRHHGMSMPERRFPGEVVSEEFPEIGYNYRMSDIHAAIGRAQLTRIPEMVERRRELASRYHTLLQALPGIRIPVEPEWARSNWQSYCIMLADDYDQQAVRQRMADSGVATQRGVACAHQEAAFPGSEWSCGADRTHCQCLSNACQRLCHSAQARSNGLILPLYSDMTMADQDCVVAALRQACGVE